MFLIKLIRKLFKVLNSETAPHEIGLGFALILACIWRMSEPETVTAVASEESESRPEESSSDLLIDLH